MRRRRNIKIIATLGPATSSEQAVRKLFRAGADAFRLNFSHGKQEDHRANIDHIRKIASEECRHIAILGDRQFKESPAIACPEGDVYNGWFKADGFDPKTQSDKDVPLLGSRQEQFLDSWSTDWQEGDWMKFVFSQSPFVCLQTLPQGTFGGQQAGLPVFPFGEKAPNDVPVADGDSNGWPQSGRNRAVRLLKIANAIHVCGDQHLGSVVQYGIEEHGDGTFVFCTPAIANTWLRRARYRLTVAAVLFLPVRSRYRERRLIGLDYFLGHGNTTSPEWSCNRKHEGSVGNENLARVSGLAQAIFNQGLVRVDGHEVLSHRSS